MKRIFTLSILICIIGNMYAQDTTVKKAYDTIRIGGMVIIKKAGAKDKDKDNTGRDNDDNSRTVRNYKKSNLSTNWGIVDLGFANYSDNTVYTSVAAQSYAPGSNKAWFDLKDGKSRNVNIWFFMQKLNLGGHYVNLKYGLGLELNNYRFKTQVRFNEASTMIVNPPRVAMDATPNRAYEKNKLAADYLTVPMMLNFDFTPKRKKGFGLSAGISAGYLYSARNKTITSDEGKKKLKDDFELEKWKLSYIAELSLGPVRFYGSYALKNMFERGLDMKPYTFGFRLSNW